MTFVTFTRRTDYPKLGWLIEQLQFAGIECRLNGESFHAPILEVCEPDLEAAWAILDPVDDLPDDDRLFWGYECRVSCEDDCDITPIDECMPYGSNR